MSSSLLSSIPRPPPRNAARTTGVPIDVAKSKVNDEMKTSPPRTPTKAKGSARDVQGSTTADRTRRKKVSQQRSKNIRPDDPFLAEDADDDSVTTASLRDSHDLSIPSRQMIRDSLVEHMVLSLDRFSAFQSPPFSADETQLYDAVGDNDYSAYDPEPVRTGPRRSHKYSYSSDYENSHDTSSSSQVTPRGPRVVNDLYEHLGGGRTESLRDEISDRQHWSASRKDPIHRVVKDSQGSIADSVEAQRGQKSDPRRRTARVPARRSSSLDRKYNYRDEKQSYLQSRTHDQKISPLDYEAAPTPIVPVGPRKIRPVTPESAYITDQMVSPPISRRLQRKRSTRLSEPAAVEQDDVVQGLGINIPRDSEKHLLPAFVKVPPPLSMMSKSKSGQTLSEFDGSAKERPGFFKRVFGSAKNNPASAANAGTAISLDETSNPAGPRLQHVAELPQPQLHNAEPPLPPPKDGERNLNKKSSSFFRRRKKSISDIVMPTLSKTSVASPKADRPSVTDRSAASPAGSLSMAMSQYLVDSPTKKQMRTPLPSRFDHSPNLPSSPHRVSIETTPDTVVTMKSVQPGSRDADSIRNAAKPSYDIDHPPGRNGAISPVQRERSIISEERFQERAASSLSTTPSERVSRGLNPIPTPAEVARDMALVAEYNRKHTKRSPRPEAIMTSKSAQTGKGLLNQQLESENPKDDEHVVLTPLRKSFVDNNPHARLEPTDSEEEVLSASYVPSREARASASASRSTISVYRSAASSLLPSRHDSSVNRSEAPSAALPDSDIMIDGDDQDATIIGSTTSDHVHQAQSIYEGNEEIVPKDKAAAWLGDSRDPERRHVLAAYMNIFTFTNRNILVALHLLCAQLILKAESQQVDRILDAFATRWCECNPRHSFKSLDVVHTICYSLLLLNTDLHLADIDSKMTRNQFTRNTMATIMRIVSDGESETHGKQDAGPTPMTAELEGADMRAYEQDGMRGEGMPVKRRMSMLGMKKAADHTIPTPLDYTTPTDECGPLVQTPFHGTMRTWEVQLEIVLKDFYNSIRAERLPLFGAERATAPVQSQANLSVFGNLRRTPSVISKAPSESQGFRARSIDTMRLNAGKWGAKGRSRPRVYPNSLMASSQTSLGDASMWSPSQSISSWSKPSFGKAGSSLSVNSYDSNYGPNEYQQSIGFAGALSQAIIREENVGSAGSLSVQSEDAETARPAPLLEDETLGLYGAPWAKEGIVKYKYHFEKVIKKSKDRGWTEVFAVVEKGYLSLFSFNSKSMRHKPSKGRAGHVVVGGGNWQDNAQSIGKFLLRQTIASDLPGGYSPARPHVWALTLPGGALHLFEVGTPEIVREFVTTANYWAARLSHHPLIGGISNIEHGWSDSILAAQPKDDSTAKSTSPRIQSPASENALEGSSPLQRLGSFTPSHGRKGSLQSDGRSSLDQGSTHLHPQALGLRKMLLGDKATVHEWTAPSQSMRSSVLMEEDQLSTLCDYVEGVQRELQAHQILRTSMATAFTPRSNNWNKAMGNWERKSSYLLKEIVKFSTYVEALDAARDAKQKVYREREERKAEMVGLNLSADAGNESGHKNEQRELASSGGA